MARGRAAAEEPVSSVPAPRANPDFFGHPEAEGALRRLYDSGRLPHALLIGGPRGIGKATLAFRFARFVLAQGHVGEEAGEGLAVAPGSGTFRRVAGGGHADLLTTTRAATACAARSSSTTRARSPDSCT
jgi:DNA polymerase-3 subunit delta'